MKEKIDEGITYGEYRIHELKTVAEIGFNNFLITIGFWSVGVYLEIGFVLAFLFFLRSIYYEFKTFPNGMPITSKFEQTVVTVVLFLLTLQISTLYEVNPKYFWEEFGIIEMLETNSILTMLVHCFTLFCGLTLLCRIFYAGTFMVVIGINMLLKTSPYIKKTLPPQYEVEKEVERKEEEGLIRRGFTSVPLILRRRSFRPTWEQYYG